MAWIPGAVRRLGDDRRGLPNRLSRRLGQGYSLAGSVSAGYVGAVVGRSARANARGGLGLDGGEAVLEPVAWSVDGDGLAVV
jgi:hypothetical protein